MVQPPQRCVDAGAMEDECLRRVSILRCSREPMQARAVPPAPAGLLHGLVAELAELRATPSLERCRAELAACGVQSPGADPLALTRWH
jgi:hypothetical protein